MKSTLFFFLSLIISVYCPLSADPLYEPQEKPKAILLLTMPKAGTYLLQKVVNLITKRPVVWIEPNHLSDFNPATDLNPNDTNIYLQHLLPPFDAICKDQSGKYIKVVLIRDPRDILISQIYWIKNGMDWVWWTPQEILQHCIMLSFNECLKYAIHFPDKHFSVRFFVKQVLKWMDDESAFICRFEDIIGPEGGGNRLLQERTIRDLSKHLNTPLTDQEIFQIANILFGGTATFRNGQIGSWRTAFNEDHMRMFKESMGEELIRLGYEKDLNW